MATQADQYAPNSSLNCTSFTSGNRDTEICLFTCNGQVNRKWWKLQKYLYEAYG